MQNPLSTTSLSLHKKLIEVRKMAPYIKKDGKGFNYTYVKESTVLGLISGAMNDYSLLLVQEMMDLQTVTVRVPPTKNAPAMEVPGIKAKFQYTWINADNPEEKLSCVQFIQDSDSEAQACGGLMTYGMRYFLLKFFNVPTDNLDPDDFKEAMDKILEEEHPKKTENTAPPTPQPKKILPEEPLKPEQIIWAKNEFKKFGITFDDIQQELDCCDLENMLQSGFIEFMNTVKRKWGRKHETNAA